MGRGCGVKVNFCILSSRVIVCFSWKAIAEGLRTWGFELESELPAPLSSIAHWISAGEQLVHDPMKSDNATIQTTLHMLDRQVQALEVSFASPFGSSFCACGV